jgi:hypothetical protein
MPKLENFRGRFEEKYEVPGYLREEIAERKMWRNLSAYKLRREDLSPRLVQRIQRLYSEDYCSFGFIPSLEMPNICPTNDLDLEFS